jgi:two-component system OmpR family response regulator
MATTPAERTARILVVDDEWSIRDLLTTALEFVGHDVRTAADGAAALTLAATFSPELILLDVNMPGVDGWEVCRRLRAQGDDTPVIFLTARDSAEDTVTGLQLGADDYLTKPFHLKVVAAHVDAVLRRSGSTARHADRLEYGGIVLDDATHQVTSQGRPVELSPTEYRLLQYLLEHAGRVVSKAQILDAVWQYDFGGDAGVVEKYMSTLRRKVELGPARVIQTVRGFGYSARIDPS